MMCLEERRVWKQIEEGVVPQIHSILFLCVLIPQ